MDRESRDTFEIIDEIQENLAIDVTPASWPIGMGRDYVGAYDLLHDRLEIMDRADRNRVAESVQINGLDDPKLADHVPADLLAKLREEVEMARELLPASPLAIAVWLLLFAACAAIALTHHQRFQAVVLVGVAAAWLMQGREAPAPATAEITAPDSTYISCSVAFFGRCSFCINDFFGCFRGTACGTRVFGEKSGTAINRAAKVSGLTDRPRGWCRAQSDLLFNFVE